MADTFIIRNRETSIEDWDSLIDFFHDLPYEDYLKTYHWEKVRNDRIKYDNEKCIVCGLSNNLQVHHRTYERLGHEDPGDVVTLCRVCHERIESIKNFYGDDIREAYDRHLAELERCIKEREKWDAACIHIFNDVVTRLSAMLFCRMKQKTPGFRMENTNMILHTICKAITHKLPYRRFHVGEEGVLLNCDLCGVLKAYRKAHNL